jgi:antitoxin component YwqK of YwqJK toxin-antitoxin module
LNRELEGLYREWWHNGFLLIECTFKNGKKEGLYQSWHKNGELYMKCLYKNGELLQKWSTVTNFFEQKD